MTDQKKVRFLFNGMSVKCPKCEKDRFIKENPDVAVNLRAEVHTCNNMAAEFVCRPPEDRSSPVAHHTMGCKFANRTMTLDDQWLIGGTRWSGFLFRFRHPIVYLKRGLRNVWRMKWIRE